MTMMTLERSDGRWWWLLIICNLPGWSTRVRPTLSDNAWQYGDSNEQPGKYKRICHEVTPLNDSRLFPPLSSGILMPGQSGKGAGRSSLCPVSSGPKGEPTTSTIMTNRESLVFNEK